MSGQSSSPCWWVKDDSTSTFWHAAGVLNSMRYSHLLGSVTCTNSFVEPHRRFTYTSNTKQRFNTNWQCNFFVRSMHPNKYKRETRGWDTTVEVILKAMEYTRVAFTLRYRAWCRGTYLLGTNVNTRFFVVPNAIIRARCRCASTRSSHINMSTRGPFLERPGNFSGPKANFKIKTCWIVPQFLAHEPIKIASFTDSFIVLFSKLLKLWSWMQTQQTQNSFRAPKVIGTFEKQWQGPCVRIVFVLGQSSPLLCTRC